MACAEAVGMPEEVLGREVEAPEPHRGSGGKSVRSRPGAIRAIRAGRMLTGVGGALREFRRQARSSRPRPTPRVWREHSLGVAQELRHSVDCVLNDTQRLEAGEDGKTVPEIIVTAFRSAEPGTREGLAGGHNDAIAAAKCRSEA